MFEKLFTSIRISQVEIKNRIGMAPMYVNGLVRPDGSFPPRAIDYFEERARGGTGLIIAGIVGVENEIERRVFFFQFLRASLRRTSESWPRLSITMGRSYSFN